MSVTECDRCSATTRSGARCKSRTCKYAMMCWQHTKQLLHLGVRDSAVPAAGQGLFTYVDIPAKRVICSYGGENISRAAYDANRSDYGVGIPGGRVIDGASTQSSIGRYANNCRPADKAAGHCRGNNARFSISTREGQTTVNIKSTKPIPAGSEIFVAYGSGYWN